jgi:hypothetical protein
LRQKIEQDQNFIGDQNRELNEIVAKTKNAQAN